MAKRNEIYKSKLRNAYLSEMAERIEIYKRHEALTVEMCQRRDLCRVERKKGLYGGYRKDILKEKLSEREKLFLICKICKGIMREASMSRSGGQSCSTCDERYGSWFGGPSPNVPLRKMISSLECCCPLNNRGCDWLGTLNDCEDHLYTCGYVYNECGLRCRMVLQRNELKVHETNNCLLRKVRCVHCDTELISYRLPTHLEMCPKMEVSCILECGKKLCRENMAQHLEQECGLVVETCKLGCGVELTRDELKIHVTDTCVQREIPCKHCKGNVKFCDVTNHIEMCPKMEVSCELCDIVMCRVDITQHLEKECGLVVETCKLGCGVELTRDELKVHEKEDCSQRKIPCKHCKGNVKFCDMTNHIDVCPKVRVSCELCNVIMYREDMTQHLEEDCVEKEIECPFAEYKCEVGLIKRKYLSQHLKEKRTEHLELKLNATELKLTALEELVMKQNELNSSLPK